MDCEGILKAWTINVVPKRARRRVTRSDSAYSSTELCADSRCWAFETGCSATSSADVSVDIVPFSSRWDLIPSQPEQSSLRPARLLFYFDLRSERASAVRAIPPLQMFSGARGRTHCARGIEQSRARAAATIPAGRTCGRSDPGLPPLHRVRCREA